MLIKEKTFIVKNLLCFGAAVKYNSITKAAELNGMKQSNFSKCMKEFEDYCGVSLFNRVYNGVQANGAGQSMYELSCDIDRIVHKVMTFKMNPHEITGDIRLWTSDGLGAGYVSSCLPDFYLKYPDVHISISCSLEVPMLASDVDMVIVYEKPEKNDIFSATEYCLKFGLFASKSYLERYGYPKSLEDIQQNHKICTRDNYVQVWEKYRIFLEKAKRIAASTNSSSMLLRLTKDGIGIGLHPIGTAKKEKDLVALEKIGPEFKHKFWIVTRRDLKKQPAVQALVKYIKDAAQRL